MLSFTIKFDTNEQANELYKRLIKRSNKENGVVDIKKDNGQEMIQKNDGLMSLKSMDE